VQCIKLNEVIKSNHSALLVFAFVIPAQAGIQVASAIFISSIRMNDLPLDPRLRGNDVENGLNSYIKKQLKILI
jgi:hypothetical protein